MDQEESKKERVREKARERGREERETRMIMWTKFNNLIKIKICLVSCFLFVDKYIYLYITLCRAINEQLVISNFHSEHTYININENHPKVFVRFWSFITSIKLFQIIYYICHSFSLVPSLQPSNAFCAQPKAKYYIYECIWIWICICINQFCVYRSNLA